MPATFAINSTGDAGDSNPNDQIAWTGNMVLYNGQMVQEVTLRAAIEQANAMASTAGNPHLITVAPAAQVADPDQPPPPRPPMVVTLTAPIQDIHQFMVIDGLNRDLFKVTRDTTTVGFHYFTVGTAPGAPECAVTFKNMTISDAVATNTTTKGGAIYCEKDLVLDSVTFSGNEAKFGGAVLSGRTLTATNCFFSSNKAVGMGADGGAVNITAGTAAFNTCKFTNNTAAGGKGGAISFNGISQMDLSNTDFFTNSGDQGGAIYSSVAGGTVKLTITGGNFDGNTSTGTGGAILLSTTDAIIDGAGFRNNSAPKGGAIYSKGNSLLLKNTTFGPNNTATLLGPLIAYDGILNQSVFITLFQNTNTGITANDLIRDV